jgi:hypothetical protein
MSIKVENNYVFIYFLYKCLMMSMTSPRMTTGITTFIGVYTLDLLTRSLFVAWRSVSNVVEFGVKFTSILTLATIVSNMSDCFFLFVSTC